MESDVNRGSLGVGEPDAPDGEPDRSEIGWRSLQVAAAGVLLSTLPIVWFRYSYPPLPDIYGPQASYVLRPGGWAVVITATVLGCALASVAVGRISPARLTVVGVEVVRLVLVLCVFFLVAGLVTHFWVKASWAANPPWGGEARDCPQSG